MLEPKARYQRAISIFLQQISGVRARLEGISEREAECLGLSLEELKEHRLSEEFRRHANSMNMSTNDLTMRLTAESEEDLIDMQMAYLRGVAKNLLVPWEDYCALNKITRSSLGRRFVIHKHS